MFENKYHIVILFFSCWVISRAIAFFKCVNNTTWYPKYCWGLMLFIDLQFSRFGSLLNFYLLINANSTSCWTILDTTSCLYVLMWLIFKIMFQADLLLSYGYENHIKAFTPHVPRSCRCLLMSATSRCAIYGVASTYDIFMFSVIFKSLWLSS